MALKSKSKLQDLLIYAGLIVAFIGVVSVLVLAVRWFSSATMMEKIVSPRQGVECLVVSGDDGVGVSCYQIPGARP